MKDMKSNWIINGKRKPSRKRLRVTWKDLYEQEPKQNNPPIPMSEFLKRYNQPHPCINESTIRYVK